MDKLTQEAHVALVREESLGSAPIDETYKDRRKIETENERETEGVWCL